MGFLGKMITLQLLSYECTILMWLVIKNLIFTILVPGTVAGYIPFIMIKRKYDFNIIQWNLFSVASLFLFVVGILIYFWCLWDFAITGRGTPAPIDAPKKLVVNGLYSYVRNPMYFGVLFVILGWGLLFGSFELLLYAIIVWIAFHLFAIFIEEPALKRQFGEPYNHYRGFVKRWIPGRRYHQEDDHE